MYLTVANLGEGPGGPAPLFLDQAEAQGPKKNFLRAGPLLSRGLDDPPPPLSEGLDPPLSEKRT